MTVYLVIPLPKTPYIHCIYTYGLNQPDISLYHMVAYKLVPYRIIMQSYGTIF